MLKFSGLDGLVVCCRGRRRLTVLVPMPTPTPTPTPVTDLSSRCLRLLRQYHRLRQHQPGGGDTALAPDAGAPAPALTRSIAAD